MAGKLKQHLEGARHVISIGDADYPESLHALDNPPTELYAIGNPEAFNAPSIAVIGPRRVTPYGLACVDKLTPIAVQRGCCIISGGARGADAQAHKSAIANGGTTVAIIAGGPDEFHPSQNAADRELLQRIVDSGGCVVSEQGWGTIPRPYMFRNRNRIIAALCDAVLVCESSLPCGTFSLCDDALSFGREVLAVPGSIFSASSAGTNALLEVGARPVVSEQCFENILGEFGFNRIVQPGFALG